jgi:hypothetical protein
METNSESPSIPTTAPLLQFTPHAKHDSSKRPTPPKLELQVKHEAEEVPSFRASPSSSEPQPQKVAAHNSSLPRNAPPNRSCILATLARHISTSVRRHDSRLECGDGDNIYAYMRTSARALALIRAVGRIASFVPRAEKEHWLRWAQIDRRIFLLLLGCVDARKADAAAAAATATTVVRRRPAQHLLRFLDAAGRHATHW